MKSRNAIRTEIQQLRDMSQDSEGSHEAAQLKSMSEEQDGQPKRRRQRGEREEREYVLETVLKALKVLEALEGRAFEPATIQRVAQRTDFSQSFCRSALLTLKEAGYAKRTFEGFIVGPKLARFASRITAAHSEISE